MGTAIMKINKKGEEKIGMGLTTIMKLLLAIASIFILIYLTVMIINFYTEQTNINRAETELLELVGYLQNTPDSTEVIKYEVLHAPRWHLFSSEFKDLCKNGPFCLCLCKDPDCTDHEARACVETDRFVLLRDSARNPKEFRKLKLDPPPSTLRLSFSEVEAYPLNAGENAAYLFWTRINGITPLFFQFNQEWQWSPDLENWMSITTTTAKGPWSSGTMTDENIAFINTNLVDIRNSEEQGIQVFEGTETTLSRGIYIIEQ